METQSLASLVHWWHAVIAIAAILSPVGIIHRIWLAPVRAEKVELQKRVAALEVESKLQKQRLDSGTARFDELTSAIKELTGCVNSLKVQLARQEGQA